MVRYWFAWTPLVVVLAVIPLALPWLGLIALMLFALIALVALVALAWGLVLVPHVLVRAVNRRRHPRGGTSQEGAPLPTVSPSLRPTGSMPAGAALLLANPPSDADRLI